MSYMAHDTIKAQTNRIVQPKRGKTTTVISESIEQKSSPTKPKAEKTPEKKEKIKSAGKSVSKINESVAASQPKTNKTDKKAKSGVLVRSPKQVPVEPKAASKTKKPAIPEKASPVKVSKSIVKQVKEPALPPQTKKLKTAAPSDKLKTTVKTTKTAIAEKADSKTKKSPVLPFAAEKKVSAAKSAPKKNEAKLPPPAAVVKKTEKKINEKTAKEVNQKSKKIEPPTTVEITATKRKKVSKKIETEQTRLIEEIIEPETLLRPIKPKKKKIKPIGSAVFRGKKKLYDFEVFDLGEIFEPIPAVYVISKRITDKRKKAHHTLVCIGETDSIPEEIKKHRKSKCLKKNHANVISILKEADAQKRLNIETDLKAAHSIQCRLE